MNSKKTFMTAVILGGTVGLAPISAWSQQAPAERRQPNPEQSRPSANENTPGTRSNAAQELSQNDMKLVQQALQEKGYNPGNITGMADDTTRATIRKFQQDNALPVTGTVDERTANKLGFQYAKKPTNPGGTGSHQSAPTEQPSPR